MYAPKLRFKQFNDSWSSYTLGEVCKFSKGKELSKADLSEKGEPCILYGELYTRYEALISSVVNKTNSQSKSLVRANKNSVLIPSSGETALDIACASALNIDDVLIGGDLNILIPNSDINGHFLSLQINGKQKVKLSNLAQGATVVHLYADSIKKLECSFPSLEEQNKISYLFETIEKKIKLQKEKIDLLKKQKKGFMQKIFSQELRFKDEEGKNFPNWNFKKIADIANVTMGQSPNGNAYSVNPANTVLIQGNADLKNGKVVPRIYTSEISKTCEENDIILTVRAPVGIVAKSNIKACIGRGVCAIKADDFLYFYLEYYNITSKWDKLSQGSTFESVNSNDIKSIIVPEPNVNEKGKISRLFNSLNQKIESEEQKLDHLQKQKQSFMQQMFI